MWLKIDLGLRCLILVVSDLFMLKFLGFFRINVYGIVVGGIFEKYISYLIDV